MPSGTGETKPLTRHGGRPPTEPAPVARRPRPGVPLAGDEPRVAASGAGQCRSGSRHMVGNHLRVPVKAVDGDPLMPCRPKRARKLIERREATPYWSHGVFCIRLDREPSGRNKQAVVVGVDPGSKREGFSARSASHDLLNIDAGREGLGRRQARSATDAAKEPAGAGRPPAGLRNAAARTTSGYRRERERAGNGNCACSNGWRRSTRSPTWSSRDVAAAPRKGARRWNASFSPLEAGKRWFYARIEQRWWLTTRQGQRDSQAARGVRAEENRPQDERPLGRALRRRLDAGRERARCGPAPGAQAHGAYHAHPAPAAMPPSRQREQGRTAEAIRWNEQGRVEDRYAGGAQALRALLHRRGRKRADQPAQPGRTGKRLCQHARIADCRPRSPLAWRFRFLPVLKDGVSTKQT